MGRETPLGAENDSSGWPNALHNQDFGSSQRWGKSCQKPVRHRPGQAGRQARALRSPRGSWCAREDSNLHPFRDQILSLARLPFRHARTGPGPEKWHCCEEAQASFKASHVKIEWASESRSIPEPTAIPPLLISSYGCGPVLQHFSASAMETPRHGHTR
jgi:hypothetical protein